MTNTGSTSGKTVSLADGHEIPMLGLGVWQVQDGPECVKAVRWALELGYRHIDTAQVYGNEESVGQALRESGVTRDEVYITTKFFPGGKEAPAAAAEASLRRLGVDYVDLYLVHWPQAGPTWAWPGMEEARRRGHARSIGVSNFNARELGALLAQASVPPAVNQIRLSPFDYRRALIEACQSRDIAVEAYSPLGTGEHLSDRQVQQLAQRVGRTPAQVLLRWCIQHDLVVLPKSTHRERIEENARLFDFELSAEDMAELDRLDRTRGTDAAVEGKWW